MADIQIAKLMERLYRIHRQLSELNGRLKKGRLRIGLREEKSKQALQELENKRQENHTLILNAKEKEKILKSAEDAIQKRKQQLNDAKNNKEYSALKAQIALDEKVMDALAEDALDALTDAENFMTVLDGAETSYKEDCQAENDAKQDWEKEKPVIEADLQRCTGLLKEAEKELTREFRPLYKRLVEGYGGEDALAPIMESCYCGFCDQKIPIHFVNNVLDGQPVVCPACGRLLFVPENFSL